MMHWSDAYIGRAFDKTKYNCAHLVYDVLKEVFAIRFPDVPKVSLRGSTRVINKYLQDTKKTPVTDPRDGDVALMECGRTYHLGVVMLVPGRTLILHNSEGCGSVVVHDDRMLSMLGLQIKEFYRFSNENIPAQ